MHSRSVSDGLLIRAAALLAVAGLHLLIAALIWKLRQPERERATDRSVVWLRLDARQTRPVGTMSPLFPSTTATATPEPPRATTTPPTPVADSAPRQIDWAANAAFNARKAIEDSVVERYRNLGSRKPAPEEEPRPPALFETERDVQGEPALDVMGDPVVRLNEYCHQELDKNVPTARDMVDERLPLVSCSMRIGKREPRGDLFDHLKRDRPLPELKPGTMSELPQKPPAVATETTDP